MIAIGGLIDFFLRWKKTAKGAMHFDRFRMAAPLYGTIYIKLCVARFTRTLGTPLTSGVPIIEAMRIVQTVVQNRVMEASIGEAIRDVIEGSGVAATLKKSGSSPAHRYPHDGGRGTQRHPGGDAYEGRRRLRGGRRDRQAGLIPVLEPLMILIMGASVGFIIMAILFPVEMSQVIR